MKVATNKINDAFNFYLGKLSCKYESREAKSMIYILMSYFFSFEKIDFIKNPDHRLSESELLKLHFAVKRLLKNEPLQYIIGETEFMGLKIKVNENVLIPRPETEELIELIRTHEKDDNYESGIVDIGCGSGCIGIALKKHFSKQEVSVLDVSEEALNVAKENAALNKTILNFIHIDILDEEQWSDLGKFQMIVSNPPYVRESEKELMQKNVLDFEPANALFIPDSDPLLFYRKIARFCKIHLLAKGCLYFEINEAFGIETKQMLIEMGFVSVEVFKDLNGKDRFIRALK